MSEVTNVEYGLEKIFEGAKDFLPLLGTDYIEFYVGNAKQAAYYYKSAFGFQSFAYKGLETGDKECASYVVKQDKIKIVLTTPLNSKSPINDHIVKHGDGVKVIALWVDDATKSWDFNQSLKLAQTAPTGNNASLSTALTIEDKVFGTVTQSTDGTGTAQANTYTLGSAGIEYDGDIISLAKGGTGQDLSAIEKGSILYGSATSVVSELGVSGDVSGNATGITGLLSLAADDTLSWVTTIDGGSW